jgi:hypothetical protein
MSLVVSDERPNDEFWTQEVLLDTADTVRLMKWKQRRTPRPWVETCRPSIILLVLGNSSQNDSTWSTGGLEVIPPDSDRERTLQRIEEEHQRFLQSRMFKRFYEVYAARGRTDTAAQKLKEQGVCVSVALQELREG